MHVHMQKIDKNIFQNLKKPDPKSHKGQNGRMLVIAGSDKFHGALCLCIQVASRMVDMVYVHSVERNLKLIDKLQQEISVFIGVPEAELWETVALVDSILIGPGLEESDDVKEITENLLKEFPEKKCVIDATALWHVNPKLLHKNCVATPHSREFEHTFGMSANAENVQRAADKFDCTVVLTGATDYISNGKDTWENRVGDVGMTKGGTGDVLSGMVAALSTTNDLITSTLAGVYLNGLAGENLNRQVGTFYNAEDVVEELGKIWKEI